MCRHVSIWGFQIRVCLSVRLSAPEKRNHHSFVNISITLVIDASMERSSRVLQHGNPKIWFFFSKKFEIEFDLYFDLCWRAEMNIQVGRNMHLYVDIGDAPSSLWGSTSSFSVKRTATVTLEGYWTLYHKSKLGVGAWWWIACAKCSQSTSFESPATHQFSFSEVLD